MRLMHHLAHARQFLLGPRADNRLEGWVRWELGGGLLLQTHLLLPCVQRELGERRLTLLGFALVAAQPGWAQTEIVDHLLARAGSLAELLSATEELSGRWVVIYEDTTRSVLVHDAGGLRTVTHTVPSCPETWCASQSGLIAAQVDVAPDPQALEFWEVLGTRIPKHIRAWPGASTAFAEITALLPNHYLDLHTREAVRFFPHEPQASITLAHGIEQIAEHLRAATGAAQRLGPVHQQITAGLDSRTLLAASRDFCAQTTYFTCLWPSLEPSMTVEHRDIDVARRLLARLGLEHQLYSCPGSAVDPAFAQVFATSDCPPLVELEPAAWYLKEVIPGDALVINGNGGEIGRCRLHPVEHPRAIAMSELCNMHWTGMQDHPFLVRHLTDWLTDASRACEQSGYRVLDLFYWEQKGGRRVARSNMHLDMAHDTYSPFFCRALLNLYLAVPEQDRRPAGGLALQHGIIRALWPEALAADINPATVGDRASRLLRQLRRRARGLGWPF
jgi:hypothetical protein